MNAGSIDFLIIGPALLAGILILITHIPLGAQVLKRGIVFIDLAIAQIAGLGVIIAGMAEFDPQGWMVQIAAATTNSAPISASCTSGQRCSVQVNSNAPSRAAAAAAI